MAESDESLRIVIEPESALPYIAGMHVRIATYPQLRQLCWNRPDDATLDGGEALALYERNWRFVDKAALDTEEHALIDQLVKRHGNGVFMAA